MWISCLLLVPLVSSVVFLLSLISGGVTTNMLHSTPPAIPPMPRPPLVPGSALGVGVTPPIMAPPIIPMSTPQRNAVPPMTVPLSVAQVNPGGVPASTVGIAPLGVGPISTVSTGISSAPLGIVPAPMGIPPVGAPLGMPVTQPVSQSLSNGSLAMGQGTTPPRPPPGR